MHSPSTRHCIRFAACLLLGSVSLGLSAQIQKMAAIKHSALRLNVPVAELHFDDHGDIPNRHTVQYLEPKPGNAIEVTTNIDRNPGIRRVMWQVSRHPFYGDLRNPVGLVASGDTTHRGFAIPIETFAAQWLPGHRQAARPNAASVMRASASTSNRQSTSPALKLSPEMLRTAKMVAATESSKTPQLRNMALVKAVLRATPPQYYLRIIPIAPDSTHQQPVIVGKPSQTLSVLIGKKPEPHPDMATFEVAERIDFDLRLVDFVYHPQVSIENWPPGCKQIPRDDGTTVMDVIEDAPGALVDAINWVAEAYSDIKQLAVSLVGAVLPFVPESVLSMALDGALAAAGIPPSLPNFDQLMTQGADYLATQVAAQIPVPASGALAEMAVDQAREEIRQRTKQALLDTAKELARRERESSPWCRWHHEAPYFTIRIRNAGKNVADGARLAVIPSSDLLEPAVVPLDHLTPGATVTVPVAYKAKRNVEYRWLSQLREHDRRQSERAWKDAYAKAKFSFAVAVTEQFQVFGDGHREESRRTLLTTPTRLWDAAPAWQKSGH